MEKSQPKVRINLVTKLRLEKANQYNFYKTEIEKLKNEKTLKQIPKNNKENQKPKKKIDFIEKNKQMIKNPKNFQTVKKNIATNSKISNPPKTFRKSISAAELLQKNKKSVSEVRRKSLENLNVKKSVPIKQKSVQNPIKAISTIKNVCKTVENVTKKVPKIELSKVKQNGENVRRSLSAVHFKRIKTKDMNSFKHKSTDELHIINKPLNIRTPIREEPDFYKRRSNVISTKKSDNKKNILITPEFRKSIVNGEAELQWDRLKKWLELKEIPVGKYHHIQCFGAHLLPFLKDFNEENKENFNGLEEKSESYENLNIKTEDQCNVEVKDLFKVANDSLYDLQKLVAEGYPLESCESWLQLITSKFSQIEDQPQYWELRAQLEEKYQNYSSAIDCYQQVIAKGAEIKTVDEPLEQLFNKFQTLNISHEHKLNKSINNKTVEASNIFKSKIINFAIKERAKNVEDDKKYLATPVRRSTRFSRNSMYTSTPGVKLYKTLDELDETIRDKTLFKKNKALV